MKPTTSPRRPFTAWRLCLLALPAPALMAPSNPGCGVCAPDLVVDAITCLDCLVPYPHVPPDPDHPGVEVVVKNAGDGSSPGFWVDLFVDEPVAPALGDLSGRYAWVYGLDPGETATLTFEHTCGAWVLDVIVDSTLEVAESSESDNLVTLFP